MMTAIIAGSSGLVGKYVLSHLLASSRYSKVVALTRYDLSITDSKLVQIRTDFTSLKTDLASVNCDDVFCCLGTTIAKAGSTEKFYEVDFKYPLDLARVTKDLGATQFLLVSALGANKDSSIFYNRVKGEVEQAISVVCFKSFHIFRPSLLLGPRHEKRPGEDAAKVFFRLFGFLVPSKYKPVHAGQVAAAMVYCASRETEGEVIHHSEDLRNFEDPQE